ncbi:PTS glucose transporter subunit IIA, partial [Klebsiella pneumoniae]|nr:PTS glucose transporter subunit IIA [Klebsiella pneumoniae]
ELVDITEVPDKVFSEKMMGDGIAIKPDNGDVYAPFDGTVKMVFPTKHAIGIESEDGVELLIHFGLETVKLEGQGFDILVKENDNFVLGQPLMKVDLDYIKEHAESTITPIVVTNLNDRTLEVL